MTYPHNGIVFSAKKKWAIKPLKTWSWRRKWQPTPVFLPGEFHGQRSLVGYTPWGHKEPDTTKWLTHKDMKGSQMHFTKWKRPIWKEYIPRGPNYMTFWRRQNYGDSKKINSCQGVRGCEEGQIGRTRRIFRAIDNTLCGAIMMDMCHYNVQNHKIYSIKSKL